MEFTYVSYEDHMADQGLSVMGDKDTVEQRKHDWKRRQEQDQLDRAFADKRYGPEECLQEIEIIKDPFHANKWPGVVLMKFADRIHQMLTETNQEEQQND
mgnify:CR=1 FL=1|tara:strand:+ start:871 stop:1170 length:300 start_codon:yes stop_codon:yes gene_type:complete